MPFVDDAGLFGPKPAGGPAERLPKPAAPEEPSLKRKVAAYGVGLAAPVVGAIVGGLPGAAVGGALGEAAREKILGEPLDPADIGLSGVISAIPGGRLGKFATTPIRGLLARGAEGAAIGAGQSVARDVLHGETPSATRALESGAGGMALGGTFGAVEGGFHPLKALSETVPMRGLRKMVSPASLAEAEDVNKIVSPRGARAMYLWNQERQLRPSFNHFEKSPPTAGLQFIDNLQNARPQPNPEWAALDKHIRLINDTVHSVANSYRKLGYREDFFPQIWKDQGKAEAFFRSRRPLRGSMRSFNPRWWETLQEGMTQGGLEPISTNPVELELAYLHDMTKFTAANEMFDSFKTAGRLKWWPEGKIAGKGQMFPEGYAPIDDAIAKRYFPRETVPVTISGDEAARLVERYGKSIRSTRTVEGSPRVTSESSTTSGGAGAAGSRAQQMVEQQVREALVSRGRSTGEADQFISRLKAAGSPAEKESIITQTVEKLRTTETTERMAFDFPRDVHTKGKVGPGSKGRFVVAGQYIAPEPVARLINNGLGRDWIREHPGLRGALRVNALMNALQLGWSAWHASFVALDSVASESAVAISKAFEGGKALSRGEVVSGVRKLAQAAKHSLTTPVAPLKYLAEGHSFYRGAPRDVPGAGKLGATGTMWNRLTGQGLGAGEGSVGTDLSRWLQQAGANLQTRGQYFQPSGWGSWDNFLHNARRGNIMGRFVEFPFAATDLAMKLLFEAGIPRMKVGAFAQLMRSEVERNADKIAAGQLSEAELARSVWGNIENRLGELNYDNLFWNNTFKTAMQLGFRAVGFNVGTVRELGGGVFKDAPHAVGQVLRGEAMELTPKMQYVLGLLTTTAGFGGVFHYLHTGEHPQSAIDYFYPKNGEVDERGQPVRVELPTYLKDLDVFKHPIRKIGGKMSPIAGTVLSLLQNRDFLGNYIYNENAGLDEKGKQAAKWLATQVEPFSLQGQVAPLAKAGVSATAGPAKAEELMPGTKAADPSQFKLKDLEQAIGIRKAPRDITEAPGLAAARETIAQTRPGRGPLTPEAQAVQQQNRTQRDTLQKALSFQLTPEDRILRQISPGARDQLYKDFPELRDRHPTDPVAGEIVRVGAFLPVARTKVQLGGKHLELPTETATKLATAEGQLVRRVVGKIISSPHYAGAPEQAKLKIIKNAIANARKQALVYIRPDLGKLWKAQAIAEVQRKKVE